MTKYEPPLYLERKQLDEEGKKDTPDLVPMERRAHRLTHYGQLGWELRNYEPFFQQKEVYYIFYREKDAKKRFEYKIIKKQQVFEPARQALMRSNPSATDGGRSLSENQYITPVTARICLGEQAEDGWIFVMPIWEEGTRVEYRVFMREQVVQVTESGKLACEKCGGLFTKGAAYIAHTKSCKGDK